MNPNVQDGNKFLNDPMNFGMDTMQPNSDFVQQMQGIQPMGMIGSFGAPMDFDVDPNDPMGKNKNRGNYRCSKCGEPKKGHVCSLIPANRECGRCGHPKKSCKCEAPETRDIAIQVELDESMTTRVLDLSVQGIMELDDGVGTRGS